MRSAGPSDPPPQPLKGALEGPPGKISQQTLQETRDGTLGGPLQEGRQGWSAAAVLAAPIKQRGGKSANDLFFPLLLFLLLLLLCVLPS